MVPGGCGATGGLCPHGFCWAGFCVFWSPSFLRQRSRVTAVLLGLCRTPFWFPIPRPLLVLTVARLGALCMGSGCL